MPTKKVDKPFLITVLSLTLVGFLIFISASFSFFARQKSGDLFYTIAMNQALFGIAGGLLLAYIMQFISPEFLRRLSPWLFIFSVILTLLVFVPGIGWNHGGSNRWIMIFGKSFQPSEFLKITSLIFMAALLANFKSRMGEWKVGLGIFLGVVGVLGAIFVAQPDMDTFFVLASALLAMYFAGGGKIRHISIIVLMGLALLVGVIMTKPYIKARVMTFVNPAANPLNSGYQIQQSLIAIGSGGITGRGFGQSLQKFNFLPEPTSDSIFAVLGEEFGFIGSVLLVVLFAVFAIRGLKIGSQIKEPFARLLVIGVVILIVVQSFMNIAAMLAIIPLSGQPLLFVSQGGTALMFTLLSVGIVLNLSRYQAK